jgi:hypothetical protein
MIVSYFLLMRFGTMGTRLIGLREKDRGGGTMSWPTHLRDSGQEAHCSRHLKDI